MNSLKGSLGLNQAKAEPQFPRFERAGGHDPALLAASFGFCFCHRFLYFLG
jgi:hypothetical protein